MTEPIDTLELAKGKRLSVVRDAEGVLAAVPMVRAGGRWRRAAPGDGTADALVHLLSDVDGVSARGRFTLQSWTSRPASGERSVGVDQTNESVIVGDTAVVKWAKHLQEGPHPAPRRIAALRDAGFTGMPTPWGIITWQPTEGAETLVVNVDAYLPGAVDGWTWAVELITTATLERQPVPVMAATSQVGAVVAEMHAALSGTVTVASAQDAARWHQRAITTLETACALADVARTHRRQIAAVLDGLGELAGTPVLEGHGDLHVGQVLLSQGRFVITDFDGNPVLPAHERMLPIPAALDVAGMAQSLSHAAIVARKYTDLDPATLADVDKQGHAAFLDAYGQRLAELGQAQLYQPRPLHAFRIQQVLREIIYAADHLPRWMYVPNAALPALLEEGTQK